MRVLVVGATGATGRLLVRDAIDAGHEVTVFVRDAARFAAGVLRPGDARAVGIVVGDATRPEDARRAAEGQEGVLSAIGSGNRLFSRIASQSARALVPAYEAAGVRRVVSLTAFGAGASLAQTDWIQRSYSLTGLLPLLLDKERADRMLRESALEWTLVAATALTNGPERGSIRFGERLPMRGYRWVSRADTARFMVARLVDDRFVRRTVVIDRAGRASAPAGDAAARVGGRD